MGLNDAPNARKPGKDSLPFAHGFAPATGNMISKLIFHPCSVPFQVYVETFTPCFLKMVLTIITWDLNDIIRNYGYAIAEPPNRRGSKRKRHIRPIKVSPRLSPAAATASNALNHVLKWSEPLEKIGYMMLLYHATEQFSRDWMSMLYNFEHCGKPESEGPYQAHCDPHNVGATGTPVLLALPFVDQNRANWSRGVANCSLPNGHFSITLEATFHNQAVNPATFSVGFFAALTVGQQPYQSATITLGPGATGSVCFQRDIFVPLLTGTDIIWWTECQPLPIGQRVEAASISIYQFQPGR